MVRDLVDVGAAVLPPRPPPGSLGELVEAPTSGDLVEEHFGADREL
jgi:hypothetical protein